MKDSDIQKINSDFIIYETDDNIAKVSVRLEEETVWLTQKQLSEIFDTTKQNIGQHVKNILEEGELNKDSVVKFFFTTATDGKSELELQKLNLLTEGFLGYAELQALEQKAMTMNDWKNFLDQQLRMLNKNILINKGSVSHKQAVEKAEHEFEIYRKREMKQLESDFDRALKQLTQQSELR